MPESKHFLYDHLISLGMNAGIARYMNMFILLVVSTIVILLIDWLIRLIIRRISFRLARISKTSFDDILIKNKLPRNLAHIPALLLGFEMVPIILCRF